MLPEFNSVFVQVLTASSRTAVCSRPQEVPACLFPVRSCWDIWATNAREAALLLDAWELDAGVSGGWECLSTLIFWDVACAEDLTHGLAAIDDVTGVQNAASGNCCRRAACAGL